MLSKSLPSKITLKIKLPYPKYRKYERVMFRLGRYCWPYIIAAKKTAERLFWGPERDRRKVTGEE